MESLSVWRCRRCQTRLGEQRGERLYLRLRKFQYVVVGAQDAIVATCGVCGLTDEAPDRGLVSSPREASP